MGVEGSIDEWSRADSVYQAQDVIERLNTEKGFNALVDEVEKKEKREAGPEETSVDASTKTYSERMAREQSWLDADEE